MDGPVWQNKGLSCVENYILHALQECDVCPDPLYYQSGLSFAEIVKCLATEKTYATFNGVDRLQHIAAEIGLIPKEQADKALCIGNAALSGASALLLDTSLRKKCDFILRKAEVVELSSNPVFTEFYISGMMFE